MKCRSKQILLPAFTLVEAVTALIILALISSSVLVVINRCMAAAADSELRMQAFEVARDNMEALLSKDSVSETVEYGSSASHPEIQWRTVVETFYEQGVGQMWVRGVCLAEYTDAAGDTQTIELTQWLTSLTKEQLLQMLKQKLSEPNEINKPNELNEPNEPNEPNKPSEPNAPEAVMNKPALESNVDCDSLPFCESIRCRSKAGTLDKMTAEEMLRYLKECH